jgi:hypothetical protein
VGRRSAKRRPPFPGKPVHRGGESNNRGGSAMTRNRVYIITIVLAVIVAVLSYQLYEARRTSGVEINVGGHSLSIEKR